MLVPHQPASLQEQLRRIGWSITVTSTAGLFYSEVPPSRLVDTFDQVVEPLITEITCLRSHELRLFHLVSAYIDSSPGGTTVYWGAGTRS